MRVNIWRMFQMIYLLYISLFKGNCILNKFFLSKFLYNVKKPLFIRSEAWHMKNNISKCQIILNFFKIYIIQQKILHINFFSRIDDLEKTREQKSWKIVYLRNFKHIIISVWLSCYFLLNRTQSIITLLMTGKCRFIVTVLYLIHGNYI